MNPEECRNFFTPSLWAAFAAGLMCTELVLWTLRSFNDVMLRRRMLEQSCPTDESPAVGPGQNAPARNVQRP